MIWRSGCRDNELNASCFGYFGKSGAVLLRQDGISLQKQLETECIIAQSVKSFAIGVLFAGILGIYEHQKFCNLAHLVSTPYDLCNLSSLLAPILKKLIFANPSTKKGQILQFQILLNLHFLSIHL